LASVLYNNQYMDNAAPSLPSWHVLWTHSNCERAVYEKLSSKGYDVFFATTDQWVADKKGKHLIRVPMFRSYLFIHHAIGKYDYIDICKTKGMVGILGGGWENLATIPDHEILAIKSLCASELRVSNHTFLSKGDKVRMCRGSLKDTQGVLLKSDRYTGLLVVSLSLLNRSVAVEVNCTDVVPL
jgi:transcription antitermination factor NusG